MNAALPNLSTSSGGLRADTLTNLRWIAIAGQTLVVLGVFYGLEFPLPIRAALLIIAASAWLNVYLTFLARTQRRISDANVLVQLCFDLVQMSVLLGLTGGLANPFIMLLVAPVVVGITALRLREALILVVMVVVAVIMLWSVYLPLPWPAGTPVLAQSDLYRTGLLLATMVTIFFTGMYVWRVSSERNRTAAALSATEAVLAREQQLAALGGLAAATAHELGTPLGTIALVANELRRDLKTSCPLRDDLDLIVDQAKSCRSILGKMGQPGQEEDLYHSQVKVSAMLHEIQEDVRCDGVEMESRAMSRSMDATSPEPVFRRMPEIIHALTAFAENAVSFAETKVALVARWDMDNVEISISDDGPGFAPEILERLGDPYVTSREGGNQKGEGGLGLGFFISKTLIERTGGRIVCDRSEELGGARVQIEWKRKEVEINANDQ